MLLVICEMVTGQNKIVKIQGSFPYKKKRPVIPIKGRHFQNIRYPSQEPLNQFQSNLQYEKELNGK